MLDRWLVIANDELIRTQRTDEFLKAQRELLSAGVTYRLKERELVEVWCETHSIPTRTEVDDLHRTVHELRGQVRDAVRPPRRRKIPDPTPMQSPRPMPHRPEPPAATRARRRGCRPANPEEARPMPEQTFRPDQSWREAVEFGARFARGAEALGTHPRCRRRCRRHAEDRDHARREGDAAPLRPAARASRSGPARC